MKKKSKTWKGAGIVSAEALPRIEPRLTFVLRRRSNSASSAPAPVKPTQPEALPIRVMIADDHPVIRKGVAFALGVVPFVRIVAEARDSEETVRIARRVSPDVIILDVWMPGSGGVAVTKALRRECPNSRIVIFSAHDSLEFVSRIMCAGATAYVLKGSSSRELVQAIRSARRGKRFLSSQLNKGTPLTGTQ